VKSCVTVPVAAVLESINSTIDSTLVIPPTCKLLLIVVVPVAAPILTVVAAPKAFTVVALVLNTVAVPVALVVISPPLTAISPVEVIAPTVKGAYTNPVTKVNC